MGPMAAGVRVLAEHPDAVSFKATLYGSLAKTGVGHLTDKALLDTLGRERTEIKFDRVTKTDVHPNTLDITSVFADGSQTTERYFSIGGGEVIKEGETPSPALEVYPLNSFTEISE